MLISIRYNTRREVFSGVWQSSVLVINELSIHLQMQLVGVVAVEVTGGPEIPFHPGREVSGTTYF